MILPLYKPVGASTHRLATKAGQLYGQKATHTGTLDPMADGVVTVLTGDDRFKKTSLSNVKKSYSYQVLLGIGTDTLDLLGLVTEKQTTPIPSEEVLKRKIEAILPKFRGEISQQIPNFSAKRIEGSSYMLQAKQGKKLPVSKQKVTIFDHQLVSISTTTSEKLITYIQRTVPLVEGDFRQQVVIDQWLNQSLPTLPVVTMTTTTSKRTYIRALVRDIAKEIGIPATCVRITRTKNGPYSIENCLCLPRAGII